MSTRKLYLSLGVIALLIISAAFIGGRLLNQRVDPSGVRLPLGGGEQFVSITINPALELPTTDPAVTGLFVERQDNTLVVASISLPAGGGSGALVMGASLDDASDAPKVEVVVTADTQLYRDTTDLNTPSADQTTPIQQKVAAGSLDELAPQTMVMVWGRTSGDRLIAEVIAYSNPVVLNAPEPEPAP